MLRQALENARVEVLGALPRDEKLVLPERHLGLVQASENGLAELIDDAADVMESQIDLDKLIAGAPGAHQAGTGQHSAAAAPRAEGCCCKGRGVCLCL
jgi:cobyrinic acid a,c-diamide synthase